MFEMGALELGSREVGVLELHSAQIRPAEVGSGQVGVLEARYDLATSSVAVPAIDPFASSAKQVQSAFSIQSNLLGGMGAPGAPRRPEHLKK